MAGGRLDRVGHNRLQPVLVVAAVTIASAEVTRNENPLQ